jgi:hypothetical protein
MREQRRGSFILAAFVAAAVAGGVVWVGVQPTSGQQGQAYRAPRLAGTTQPDLNGIWQALNTANYDVRPHAARPALATVRGPSGDIPAAPVLALGAVGGVPAGLGVVDGNEIPYQPWAAQRQRENLENALTRDPEVKCYLPGVPRATYMPYPFQIVQTPSHTLFAYEYASASRIIYMQDREEAPIDSWMGTSHGRWDGDTLVIDVTGFNGQTWFDRAGNFHSEALKVTERYTPSGPDHLQYEATIEDPKVFTRPWKISMPLYRRKDPRIELLEYKCVEFVEELMFGHLRKEQLVRTWQQDLGEFGGLMTIDLKRAPSKTAQ